MSSHLMSCAVCVSCQSDALVETAGEDRSGDRVNRYCEYCGCDTPHYIEGPAYVVRDPVDVDSEADPSVSSSGSFY